MHQYKVISLLILFEFNPFNLFFFIFIFANLSLNVI